MPLAFNTAPYYDDYDAAKQFYQILARPGKALQVRELNQLQSILDEQIKRLGQHIFKEGSMVIPGQITYDQNFQYVKVDPTYNGSAVAWDVLDPLSEANAGQVIQIQGVTTGVVAQVVKVKSSVNAIYIKYVQSGTDNTTKVFADGEVLKIVSSNTNVAQAISSSATGETAAASIQDGVYFIFGKFVKVFSQTIIVADFDSNPSARVGLSVEETIVTPEDDESLLDNASGTPNYAAPGAHRYKIDLILTAKAIDTITDENFVELLRVDSGTIQRLVNKTFYSEVEKTLARRTDDANGSFTVRPFKLNIREHLQTATNGGVYPEAKGGDATKLAVGLEPGKAYVQGYEIETICTDYVPVDKARETAYVGGSRTRTYLGNYVYIDRLFGIPSYDLLPTCNLYEERVATDGVAPGATEIGTATIRGIEFKEGTFQNVGQNGPIFKCYLTDINITGANKTLADVRALAVSDGTLTITANVLSEVGIINPVGDFSAGTTITSGGVTENVHAWNTTNNTLLTLPPAGLRISNNLPITSSASGAATLSWRVLLQDIEDNILVFPLPESGVSTVRNKSNQITATYSYRKTFPVQAESGARVVFQTDVNENFASVTNTDFVATIEAGANAGKLIDVSSANPTLQSSLTQLSFDAPAGTTIKLSATVVKHLAAEKSKTLKTDGVLTVAAPAPDTITLNKCDCYRPIGIWEGTDNTGTPINDRYIFDTGQRANLYDFGTLTLKPGAVKPTGSVYIEFEYFDHGAGDFFSVDSYRSFGNFTDWYERIPYFVLPNGTPLMLRDCLDFRPKRDETNSASITYPSGIGKLFKPNDDVTYDFSYYLARIDKLYLNNQGNFQILKGSPSLKPVAPEDPKDGMVIAVLRFGPYTFGPKDCMIRMVDNRRYTMRDIGGLDRRIQNLEYYTALNLLEKETASYAIPDAATGLDRFKNGFVVDPFADHRIADVYNPDCRYSIDAATRTLRPQYYSSSLDMAFNSTQSSDVEYRSLKSGNDVVTLPYTEEALITQDKASRTENLNPYNVFNFAGSINLDPATDTWKDTENRPDVLVEDNSAYDAVVASQKGNRALATVWNEWTTDWVGVQKENIGTRTETSEEHSVPQTGNEADEDGQWSGFQGFARQTITTYDVVRETTTTGQTRRGITTQVVPQVTKQNVDERVLNVALVPYIRSREVTFKATRLKPFTRHYAFFDEVDVSAYCKPANGNYGDAMITDAAGELSGTFNIPNSSAARFRVGRRVFRLVDDSQNRSALASSFADTQYNASGILETKQKTITSIREAKYERKEISETRVVTTTKDVMEAARVQWVDPLAQSILVDTLAGGFMTTGVDLFFRTKDSAIPVTMQIREMENGIPTQKIVPFSEVTLKPASVQISEDASLATRFSFESPVYLQQGVEYAIVIMSNSNGYNAWVAKLGDTLLNTDRLISQVPYTGVLFKSQNASTWTPEQTESLKFVLYRAKFNTGVTGKVFFQNPEIPVVSLPSLSLITYNGSNVVRVLHPDHGMPATSKVTIAIPAGAANANWSASYNGIPVADIVPTQEADLRTASQPSGVADTVLGSRTYTISNVELDSYTISITDGSNAAVNATSSGYSGVVMTATANRAYDVLMPLVQELNFSGTRTNWYIRDITGKSTHGTQTPYQRVKTGVFPYTAIVPNQNVYFEAPRLVASKINEDKLINIGVEFDNKSLLYYTELVSTVDNLSPMIDTKRCAAILVSNRIDNRTASATPATTPSGAAPVFVAETAAIGATGPCRYIHRPANLKNPSNSIHVILSVMRPPESTVEVYYRVLKADSYEKFEDQSYVLMTASDDADMSAAQNANDYKEYYYKADDIGSFTTFAIKIVMRSTNSSKVPLCKDLRAIALDE